MVALMFPSASATAFPRSPTRSSSVGPPWVFPNGLKCPPVDLHPFVRSPCWWMWDPWFPSGTPLISTLIVVSASALAWEKETVPEIPPPTRVQEALRPEDIVVDLRVVSHVLCVD